MTQACRRCSARGGVRIGARAARHGATSGMHCECHCCSLSQEGWQACMHLEQFYAARSEFERAKRLDPSPKVQRWFEIAEREYRSQQRPPKHGEPRHIAVLVGHEEGRFQRDLNQLHAVFENCNIRVLAALSAPLTTRLLLPSESSRMKLRKRASSFFTRPVMAAAIRTTS
jgi:hypothetical protein